MHSTADPLSCAAWKHHYDHMLASLQHVERIRKFSLQTEENKSVCSARTRQFWKHMLQNGSAGRREPKRWKAT